MSYLVYKIIHLAGVMSLFASLGGLMAADHRKPATLRGFTALHGASLFILLVSGFGMHAKLGIEGFPIWMIIKLVVWLLMGAALVVFKRRLIPTKVAMAAVIILGIASAYLGIYKPF